ncbi:hypothetical protein Tco_0991158 [Tanacetum coccineum]|uniref:Uncharacterized protein n=1 Tax=Tanacetum coccineum TaxID=301880 RepID=A0ABQ5EZG7_9ASTR
MAKTILCICDTRESARAVYSKRELSLSEGKVIKSQRAEEEQIDAILYEIPSSTIGTLDDVRNALNDRLKGIRTEYLGAFRLCGANVTKQMQGYDSGIDQEG